MLASLIFSPVGVGTGAIDFARIQITDKNGELLALSGHNRSVITDVEEEEVRLLPSDYRLWQNHPNPFNPVTQIAYDFPEAGEVRLTVYTLTGQKVAVLVDGHRDAGYHTATWDARGVGSGVYVYRMEAGSFVGTRKMVKVE